MFTKRRPDQSKDFPCFDLNYDFLARFFKEPLTLTSPKNQQQPLQKKTWPKAKERKELNFFRFRY